MSDSQAAELEQTANSSMSSNTIEWALNFRVCDLVQANPSLMPTLNRLLIGKLRQTTSPVPVLLALSLLEIVAKNCGFVAVQFIDEELIEALLALVKKREGLKYSIGRNMFKTFGASTLMGTIDEGSKDLWAQASMKVREMLQLWTDAFLLQQGQLRPVFTAYKRLRQEGYTFPELKQGASAEIALMKGAEESPAFLASGATVTDSPEPRPSADLSPSGHSSAVLAQLPPDIRAEILAASAAADAPEERAGSVEASPSAPPQPAGPRINLTPATVEATRDLCRELRELDKDPSSDVQRLDELRMKVSSAREEATRQIQKLMTSQSGGAERFLESLMLLLDDLNDVLPSQEAGPTSAAASPAQAPSAPPDLLDLNPMEGGEAAAEGGSSSSAPLPPPPEEAPPDREQQEEYDLILARYLQERENEAFAVNEDEDAALALRLSLEEFGGDADAMATYGGNAAQPSMISCGQCRAVNQLERGGSGLFICYACGVTQQTPGQPTQSSRPRPAAPVPTRHAPPARVICAPGASELIIGGGGAAPAETPSTGGYVPPMMAGASGAPLAAQSFEGMGNQALLGAPPKSSKAKFKMSMPSFSTGGGGSSSYSTVKDLGDGGAIMGGASEYTSMGDGDEGFSMLGGSAPPSKNTTSSGLVRGMMNWGKKKDADRGERVQVNEEWELIQPSNQRPYYFNSQTQASQWQPPDVISSNTGLLSGLG